MLYLCLAFSFAWACHFAYLFAIDRHAKRLHQRLDARVGLT